MTVRMSSTVTTRWTPASACAALTSMLAMRPCATVLRTILPYSMPGRRRLCTYSARPVTLASPFEPRDRAPDLAARHRSRSLIGRRSRCALQRRRAARARRRRAQAAACRPPSRDRRRSSALPRPPPRPPPRQSASPTRPPRSACSTPASASGVSVAALTTIRASRTVVPSLSSATATPSAGQSCAARVVHLR